MKLIGIFWQEPVRTKHPQLLYETKLYRILQGGGKFSRPDFTLALQPCFSVEKWAEISLSETIFN